MKKKPKNTVESRRWQWLVLVGVCLLVFANAISAGFAWDDEVEVLKNPKIRTLDPVDAFR